MLNHKPMMKSVSFAAHRHAMGVEREDEHVDGGLTEGNTHMYVCVKRVRDCSRRHPMT